MKKLIPALFLVLLLVSCLVLTAGAATADLGETVTLYVTLPAAAPAQMGGISFTYDDTALSPVSGTWLLPGEPLLASVDLQKNTATFLYGEEQEISGDILALTMRIKEGAAFGDYTVKAEVKLVAEGGTMEGATAVAATVTPLTVACDHENTEPVSRLEPSCTAEGYTAGTRCLDCGAFVTGHEPLSVISCLFTAERAEEAYFCREKDCTHGDLYYKSCTMCGKADLETTFAVGDPLPHRYGEQEAEAYLKEPATCMSYAVYYRSCMTCGAADTKTFTGTAYAPHDYSCRVAGEAYLAAPATCTAPTLYYLSCACGAAGAETFAQGACLPHTPGTAATCTAPQTCTVCAATLQEALGHSYAGEKETTCTRCGAVRVVENDTKKDNGTGTTSCKSHIAAAAGWQPALLLALAFAIALMRKKQTGHR